MEQHRFLFTDTTRKRNIPVAVHLPDTPSPTTPLVIFNPGYQDQDDLLEEGRPPGYLNYRYLATFFTARNHAFISIQHDIIGDSDGLETIDPHACQHDARQHLYRRGIANIQFAITALKPQFPTIAWERFIIAGHSNGGDIAKYFANHHPERVNAVIALDARRCRIDPTKELRLLMFEANDTTTDNGVLPDAGTEAHPLRNNLEWVVVKPKNALHVSYNDAYITEDIRHWVCSTIDWFLR